ncbi:hypothetical protein J0910_06365 [Nocardiopsis sp. CNT-189]|uniref:hypothetical protein n=1 Tax=Nocardiopsis oceanisediminis TaxID=2816862 RepID=UPI003B354319
MPEHPEAAPGPQHPRRPQFPRGAEYPEGEAAPGGYQAPDPGYLHGPPRPPAQPPAPAGAPAEEEEPRAAGEPFRRSTRARRKPIPAVRGGGHGRLIAVTVLFIMVTGGSADYISSGWRAALHLLFWGGVAAAGLIAAGREERNGWEPSPRWVWPAAAVGGTLLAELLIALFGSPAIIAGSVAVAGLFLFLVMLFG